MAEAERSWQIGDVRVTRVQEQEALLLPENLIHVLDPARMALQLSHSPHGSAVGPLAQLSERARMRAVLVLPQPRGPENRYACAMRPDSIVERRVAETNSWPASSPKLRGRFRDAVIS